MCTCSLLAACYIVRAWQAKCTKCSVSTALCVVTMSTRQCGLCRRLESSSDVLFLSTMAAAIFSPLRPVLHLQLSSLCPFGDYDSLNVVFIRGGLLFCFTFR